MSPAASAPVVAPQLRDQCRGEPALTARLAAWQLAVLAQPERIDAWLSEFGSPLNVLGLEPFAQNAAELTASAARQRVRFRIFFARKANKCLAFVDEAHRLGFGVDLASEPELRQALERGVAGRDLIVTAAVKPSRLLELALASEATVALDNGDEIEALSSLVAARGGEAPVALRLGNFTPALRSRFGIDAASALAVADAMWGDDGPARGRLRIEGVHFHLDGYAAPDRVEALALTFPIVDELRRRGHRIGWVDIGGGIPMSYLDSADEWERFWAAHHAALVGRGARVTFADHALGLAVHEGAVSGAPRVYPNHQRPIRGEWLEHVLAAPVMVGDRYEPVSDALRHRDLELRCEPGRALLDGCGLTAARVEFRKRLPDGEWLIGLDMNRTQCRSAADDHLVDPIVLRGSETLRSGEPIAGYLVGAYCIERELLTWRRLTFPHGVQIGDIVVFPNTAGYFMHILESRAHQLPLARNVVFDPGTSDVTLDPIDC